jgi:hypothetical protein
MSDDLRVNWDAVNWNGDQGSYEILRSVDGGSYSQIGSVNSGTTYYDDNNLNDGEQYSYKVRAVNSGGSSTSSANSGTTSLPQPTGVSATFDANDQITVSWNDTINNGQYRIQISRDGSNWEDPSGGPTRVGHNTTSQSYGPKSDYNYESQVGIDSSFKFRVRSETEHTTSGWDYSGTIYTEPIPPHNPSVSRPGANQFEISWETKTDIVDYTQIQYRIDTGSGYGGWQFLDNQFSGTSSFTWTTTSGSQSGDDVQEDARYQFRIKEVRRGNPSGTLNSEWVYADYGNNNNVYFEDDFESNGLSAWDSNNLAGDTGVQSGAGDADLTIGGADEGTYYFYGEGEGSDDGTWLQKDLGDLSNENDVLVKCAFATASLDSSAEDFGISWYDGSSWQSLKHFGWEYNRQGWYEVSVLVPTSYLSTNNHIRVGTTTSTGMYGGDHFAIDRVVVSDILHEYTKPAAPSSLSLDNSTEREITASWTRNASVGTRWEDIDYRQTSDTSWNGTWSGNTSESFTGLLDGEQYEVKLRAIVRQNRHGSPNDYWYGGWITPQSATTSLPSPTSLSVSNIGSDTADLSWTDNANNEDTQRVYLEEAGNPTGMDFSGGEDININEIKLTSDFTISQLLKNPDGNSWNMTMGDYSGRDFIAVKYGNEFWIAMGDDANRFSWSIGDVTTETHLYTLTRSGSTLELFVDGVSQGTKASDLSFTLDLLGTGYSTSYFYQGIMADIHVYDRALSSTEVSNLYNGDAPANGLVGHWPLDQNNAGTTPDVSEYANDGEVNGPTIVGNGLTDKSGSLSAGTENYTLSALLNDTTYNAYVHTETEHSTTRDT